MNVASTSNLDEKVSTAREDFDNLTSKIEVLEGEIGEESELVTDLRRNFREIREKLNELEDAEEGERTRLIEDIDHDIEKSENRIRRHFEDSSADLLEGVIFVISIMIWIGFFSIVLFLLAI